MLAYTILWDWFDGTRHFDQNTFLYVGLLSFLIIKYDIYYTSVVKTELKI